MPFLILQHRDDIKRRSGILLNGRALIGRWASNEIVVDDPRVSRVHAWVAHADGQYVITDARSRTGTRVNGRKINDERCALNDGDEIKIGRVMLTFGEGEALPDGVEAVSPPPPSQRDAKQSDSGGILFDCICLAPLWAPHVMAGKIKKCHYCRQRIIIPSKSGTTTILAAPRRQPADVQPRKELPTCSICQWTIDDASEETSTCSDCGLTFHAECWSENFGCSSYGCPQVNALAPKDEKADADAADAAAADVVVEPPHRTAPRWDTVLLAASVTASLIGMLLFGLPAIVVVGAIAFYLYRGGAGAQGLQRRAVITLATAVAIVGSVAGVAVSYWWWT